jgi:hypothetical protein
MSSGNNFWYDHLPQVGSFLLSPVAGFAAAWIFATEKCTTIPGGDLGGFQYQARDICSTQPNDEAGVIIGCIVLALAGVWLLITIIGENQPAKPAS